MGEQQIPYNLKTVARTTSQSKVNNFRVVSLKVLHPAKTPLKHALGQPPVISRDHNPPGQAHRPPQMLQTTQVVRWRTGNYRLTCLNSEHTDSGAKN